MDIVIPTGSRGAKWSIVNLTKEQITFALRQAELGIGVEEVCSKVVISDESLSCMA